MPASRSPARMASVGNEAGTLSPQSYEAHPDKGTPTKAQTRDAPVPAIAKRRRSPNAFILFRSFIIANKLFPPELTHQNDVSRYIAELWRSGSPTLRSLFFQKADAEKLRVEIEGQPEPYRTKRVRTRKARPSKATESNTLFYLPESPTVASEASPSPVSFSPDMASANANQDTPIAYIPFGLPSTSIPETPQVIDAIPLSLSSWGHPTEMQSTERQTYPDINSSFNSGASSFLSVPYDNLVSFDVATPSRVDSFSPLVANNLSQMYDNSGISSLLSYVPCYGLNFLSFDT